jgi:hypothetical protein
MIPFHQIQYTNFPLIYNYKKPDYTRPINFNALSQQDQSFPNQQNWKFYGYPQNKNLPKLGTKNLEIKSGFAPPVIESISRGNSFKRSLSRLYVSELRSFVTEVCIAKGIPVTPEIT